MTDSTLRPSERTEDVNDTIRRILSEGGTPFQLEQRLTLYVREALRASEIPSETTTKNKDHGAGLAAVVSDTTVASTETARTGMSDPFAFADPETASTRREALRKHIAAIDGRRPLDGHSDRGFSTCPHPNCRAAHVNSDATPYEEWRLVRPGEVGPVQGGHGSWVETDHVAVIQCMGSAPACAENGCQFTRLAGDQRQAETSALREAFEAGAKWVAQVDDPARAPQSMERGFSEFIAVILNKAAPQTGSPQ